MEKQRNVWARKTHETGNQFKILYGQSELEAAATSFLFLFIGKEIPGDNINRNR